MLVSIPQYQTEIIMLSGPVHTTGTTLEEFENTTISPEILHSCFKENSDSEIACLSRQRRF